MSSLGHRLDIYEVDLFICTTRREWNAQRRKHKNGKKIDLIADRAAGFTHEVATEPNQEIWIYVDGTGYRDFGAVWLAGTAAHEATHAAHFMFEHRWIPMEGEPLAHTIGYLTKMIVDLVDGRLNGPTPE